jgi:multidrug efflux system membrane fusion protein
MSKGKTMKNLQQLTATARPLAAALALAGLAGLATLGLAGCDAAVGKDNVESSSDAPAANAGAPVSAATVVEKQIVETQEFSGRLEAIDRVDIRARIGGFITAVNFKPGSEVKKGDVLFTIDARPYQAEASRAEAAAASARAKADLAKLELARAQKLVAEKAIPQRELDESASSVQELDANVRAAQASLEAARVNLAYTRVQAPIDGRVSKAEITVGNLVDTSAILTSVVSLERIYATFDGDEDTYLRVGPNMRGKTAQPVAVRIGLANETGFPHEGKLEFVDNRLDPQTGSVRMRAILDNADRVLVPGLFARVELAGGNGGKAETRAVLISDRAVGTDQSRKFVFVVGAGNKAEYRPVTLGQSFDGLRVVRSGLKPGEKIVVNGLQRVRPGAPLSPQTVTMESLASGAPAPKADATVAKSETGKAPQIAVASATGAKE